MSNDYNGKVNGKGENRQKFLKEVMALAPLVHASGILENRDTIRKKGFKNVADAVEKRAKIEKGRANLVDHWVTVRLFGGTDGNETFKRALPRWAQRKIERGAKWPLTLFGFKVIVEAGIHKEEYQTTTVAIYRFFRLKAGQRFIWGES